MKINKLDLLIGIYIFCIFASEVMWAKTFPLVNLFWHQFNASVAIFLLPVIYSINDIIVEVFGKERMKQIVKVSIIIIVLIILTSMLFTWLPPTTRFSGTETAYDTIFSMSIRMSLASIFAFVIANFLDIYIFSKIREKLWNKRLWFRNNVSNIISQFFDTFVFMILAFYSFDSWLWMNLSFIISVWLPYWILKCFMSLICTPFVYLGVSSLKNDKK